MQRLTAYIEALRNGEDFLLGRVMVHSIGGKYTRYTSTKEDDWRMTVREPARGLVAHLEQHAEAVALHVDDRYGEDHAGAFGVREARLHRARGVDFVMFLALSKIVCQAFVDLAHATPMSEDERARAVAITHRFFDRFELGFCGEWVSHQESDVVRELQTRNRQLTNEKNKYQLVFDSVAEPVVMVDREGRIAEANAPFQALIGDRTADWRGRRCGEVLGSAGLVDGALDECLRTGGRFTGIEKVVTRDGQRAVFVASGGPIDDISTKYAGAVAVLLDVTERERRLQLERVQREELERRVAERTAELSRAHAVLEREIEVRKQAEEESRASRELLAALADATTDAIYVKDREGRYVVANAAVTRFLGRRPDEVLGRDDTAVFPPAEAQAVMERDRGLMEAGQVMTFEEQVSGADGKVHTFHATKGPLRDERGAVHGLFGISRDVTEYKELEASLHHAQRMEAVGTMAAGVAHDFNNLMVPVLGNAELLSLRRAAGSEDREMLAEIMEAARRAGELSQLMVAFARGGKVDARPMDLDAAVRLALSLQRRAAPARVTIEERLAGDLAAVKADATQMGMVVMNLVLNAIESIERAGTVRVITRNVMAAGASAPAFVELVVDDTGCGMTPEVLARIFEPFFTTKFLGRGLGLAATYGIVRNHGGTLAAQSEPGRGTRFTVTLPAIRDRAVTPPRPLAEDVGGSGTVLVVDDEPGVLATGRRMLEALGYVVLTAGDGQAAVEVASRHAGPIHAVLLDLGMPVLGGAEAMPLLLGLGRGALKVLLCSGYDLDNSARALLDSGASGFLRKPFRLGELATALREALAAPAA